MKIPHPIPYQGSKRNLAGQILRFLPHDTIKLVEPFAGSAAITIATAYFFKADSFVINDINTPLINLWDNIINKPKSIINSYHDLWNGQLGNEEKYYYEIRELFNKTREPEYLLFLLAKCVKSAVRYNASGEFNQSPDKRRLGRNPELMRNDIVRVSKLLKGKVELHSTNYTTIFDIASPKDIIYLDPPYQGTGLNGGFNYSGSIEFNEFVLSLFDLNKRGIPFILSFDGRTGTKIHGNPLPQNLNLIKIEVNAGRSSQATLLNRDEITFESIYLSPTLVKRIDLNKILSGKYGKSLILQS